MIPGNDDTEKAMASPTLAASASDDGKIMLWDLLTTEIVHHSNAGCTAAIHAGTGVASSFSIPVGVSHLVVAPINKSDNAKIAAPLRIFVGRADGSVAMLDLHSAEVLCTQQVTKRSRIQSHKSGNINLFMIDPSKNQTSSTRLMLWQVHSDGLCALMLLGHGSDDDDLYVNTLYCLRYLIF